MDTPIADPGQATPEWLTETLRASGWLPCGEVARVTATVETSYTSTIARLALAYAGPAPAEAPARLLLKLSRLDSAQSVVGAEQRRREVEFHRRVAVRMVDPPVVRCYHAAYRPETGQSSLLFDDLSATHTAGSTAQPPARPQGERAIDAFAAVHAFWWDHPALGELQPLPSPESAAGDVAEIGRLFPRFADFLGDRLDGARRRLYEQAIAALPRLLERATQGKRLTLIHGDANLSNVLLPRDAAGGRAFIIDWQLWGVSFGAEDLAHMMALSWSGGESRALERDLLRRYHARLLHAGVTQYGWEDCRRDYQQAVVVRVLFMPLWFWATGAPEASVERSLANALQAFADLDCRSLLSE